MEDPTWAQLVQKRNGTSWVLTEWGLQIALMDRHFQRAKPHA